MFNKMALNPAAAGIKDAMEATLIYHQQWADIPGAPNTGAFMLQDPLNNKNMAWGVEVMSDKTGPATNTMIQGNYAYNIQVGSGKLAMGLGLQLYNYSINYSQLDMPDKSSDIFPQSNTMSKFLPDADAGVFYSSNTSFLGISFDHLLQPNFTGIEGASTDFTFHSYLMGGRGFVISPNLLLEPSFILQWSNNAPISFNLNLNALLSDKIWVGISVEPQYGIALLADYRVYDWLQVGYACNLGLNGIGNAGGMSNEISLSIDFGTKKLVQLSPRYL